MAKTVSLDERFSIEIKPTAPFNFDATVHKPSYFPTRDNYYQRGVYWQTMLFKRNVLGLKLMNRGNIDNPLIELVCFSEEPFKKKEDLVKEIRWRFDLDSDISEFCQKFEHDNLLGPVLKKWRGMRVNCTYSLYEILVITIVLQNAPVRRSIQMMEALFSKYGTKACYNGKELYAFWEPERLHKATEEELRALKVGYRAKNLKKISESFVNNEVDEYKLRTLDKEEAKKQLMKLYGVGPASVGILLFESLHHYDAFDKVSPWEQKIYSRLLLGKELVPPQAILDEVNRRWGKWKMLAAHYIFEDLFWKRETQHIDWLEKLIRR